MTSPQEAQVLVKELKPLVGLKLSHVAVDGAWVGLVLEDGTVLTFSRDPEGNGPGFVFVNRPKPAKRSRK